MNWNPVVTSPKRDQRLVRSILFWGAPIVLTSVVFFAKEVTREPGQFVVGIVIAAAMAMLMVLIGVMESPAPRRS